MREFVDGEEASDAVAGAVRVIEPGLPQRTAGEAVELRAARALGEDRGGDRDVALKDSRKAVAHLVGRFADRHGARDVGRAVAILSARIDQMKAALFEVAVGLFAQFVM